MQPAEEGGGYKLSVFSKEIPATLMVPDVQSWVAASDWRIGTVSVNCKGPSLPAYLPLADT